MQLKLTKIFLMLAYFGFAQNTRYPSEAIFIENRGQWEEDFAFKLNINNGAFFFEEEGFSLLINKPEEEHEHSSHQHHSSSEALGLRLRWQNANIPYIEQAEKLIQTHHYILGNDPKKWQQNVPLSKGLTYYGIYQGINLKYFGNGSDLEYDIEIEPHADPSIIAFTIEGVLNVSQKGNELKIVTAFGNLIERIPLAYQEINGSIYKVRCSYSINHNVVSFNIGKYDTSYPLIIDPVLEFSTMTGSASDNFGFTATYDDAGNFYAGGIASSNGYPITTGAFQNIFAGGNTDVSITKFNPTGTQAIYSTYIGGNNLDLPHSMICANDGTLYILGNTASPNFPMYANAYQDSNWLGGEFNDYQPWSFPEGSDVFILALSPDGSTLNGGSFIGGDSLDGVNSKINENYGDLSRGEIILDDQNNVYITTSFQSPNMSFNGNIVPLEGLQDALLASFNTDLSILRWGTLYGGTGYETGYGIKLDANNKLFLTGGSTSSDLDLGANSSSSYSQRKAGIDGYVARFNADNGTLERASYLGGANKDQSFFVDIDRSDNVYLYGQTTSTLATTAGTYRNPGSRQFITKLNNDLDTEEFYTVVGSSQNKYDLVPTAFLVDDCYKIYISGWNGTTNANSINVGSTQNLPVTADAFQSVTDGSDFYFMVLGRNASNLIYGSYFGGNTEEHVDGGTSRFDPKGIIYQAVCASCGGSTSGFPTTPGAYSEIDGSGNCNLGAIKLDFQTSVKAIAEVDFSAKVDTICNTLFVEFTNNSINADIYTWDFDNGQTSSLVTPSTSFDQFGNYTIKLIATDTVCDLTDSVFLDINHDTGVLPEAAFDVQFTDCDKTYEADFLNLSRRSTNYEWNFGDGTTSTDAQPIHNFPNIGTYTVTLIAKDTICNTENIIVQQVEFTDTIAVPSANIQESECMDGSLTTSISNPQPWYKYTWADGLGNTFSGDSPRIVYTTSGLHFVELVVLDTICNALYKSNYKVRVGGIQNEVFVPNAFTPNNDDKNEKFLVFGNRCTKDDRFIIYDRWGKVVFETTEPYTEFWDAMIGNNPAKEDVYIYLLQRGSEIQRGKITLIR